MFPPCFAARRPCLFHISECLGVSVVCRSVVRVLCDGVVWSRPRPFVVCWLTQVASSGIRVRQLFKSSSSSSSAIRSAAPSACVGGLHFFLVCKSFQHQSSRLNKQKHGSNMKQQIRRAELGGLGPLSHSIFRGVVSPRSPPHLPKTRPEHACLPYDNLLF